MGEIHAWRLERQGSMAIILAWDVGEALRLCGWDDDFFVDIHDLGKAADARVLWRDDVPKKSIACSGQLGQ